MGVEEREGAVDGEDIRVVANKGLEREGIEEVERRGRARAESSCREREKKV